MCTKFWVGTSKVRDHPAIPGVDWRIILKYEPHRREVGFGLWIRFIYLRIGTGGGLL
jgi:hypothetical protein